MDIKHNVPLLVALAIPVLMIALVAGAIYLPRLWAEDPQYDFLYAVGSYPTYLTQTGEKIFEHSYAMAGEQLTVQTRELPQNTGDPFYPPLWRPGERQEPRLYVHDVETNVSREVTAAEAQALQLETEQESPDGFEVDRSDGGNGFPFGYSDRDYDARWLRGHGVSEKLNVKTGGSDYPGSFNFIGWVLEAS